MHHRHCGLGLVELVVAMAVVALLAGLGLPAFRQLVQQQQLTTALHTIGVHLATARIAAVTQRTPVTVCPIGIDGRCRDDSDWSEGLLLYRDPQRRNQPAQPDHVLRRAEAIARGGLHIHSSECRRRVRFQPDGRSGGSNLRLRFCRDGRLLGEVVVNNSGRIRSARLPQGTPCDGATLP